MMRALQLGAVLFGLSILSACGSTTTRSYTGPAVTMVYVDKSDRQMFLMHGDEVLAHYQIDLGFEPEGHKVVSGDGRTPEGWYTIDRRNPNSRYHLSIGINYPNTRDAQVARALGADPGGNIFIHGQAGQGRSGVDWTAGCIAVTDAEMEEIYSMVRDGTRIFISP